MPGHIVSINDYTGTNVARLKAAAADLALQGGGVLLIPGGTYDLDSAELAQPVTLTDNITVEGCSSVLTVTGTAQTSAVFAALDRNNVTIRNLSCTGNSVASGYNNGAFFNYFLTATAAANTSGVLVEDVTLDNFKAPYWICVENLHASRTIVGVTIRRISAYSKSGNAISPTDITWNASVIGIVGNQTGVIERVHVSDLYVDASHIKSGVILYHGVRNALLDNLSIFHAGYADTFANDAGAYAVQIYDSYGVGSGILVQNVRLSARSCGIYVAGQHDVTLSGFVIEGQLDTLDGSLPKGAIAINGTVNCTVRDGTIRNCARGIEWSGPSANERCDGVISNVKCYEAVTLPLRIKPYTAPMNGLAIDRSRFVGLNYGAIVEVNDSSLVLNDFSCENSSFAATAPGASGSYGLDAFALVPANPIPSGNWRFENCAFTGASAGLRARNVTGRVTIVSSTATGTGAGTPFHLAGSTDLVLKDLEARLDTGSTHFEMTGAQGSVGGAMRGYPNGAVATGLGTTKPGFAKIKGDYVKYINFAPAPAGNGQTFVSGWLCDGGSSWRPVVETVNAA
ncbi:hypothetical protein FHS95_002383 [Sphingomonas naasensis]|uniref:Right-handed parallel beta-helix repeat-containing protein n=1 Tax=Sphingomonas naasensis TaxID=1344951 RepID=A0A4S1WAM7_9SPHN|nr:hypothetical protein [Sphingomonas naasensis]NIJ20691.1 hypothetical protein [Sphingomonas naasensis]TGX37586.1 hypothetical protein E5A74_19765 [Sphingomonas naasensis]